MVFHEGMLKIFRLHRTLKGSLIDPVSLVDSLGLGFGPGHYIYSLTLNPMSCTESGQVQDIMAEELRLFLPAA